MKKKIKYILNWILFIITAYGAIYIPVLFIRIINYCKTGAVCTWKTSGFYLYGILEVLLITLLVLVFIEIKQGEKDEPT